MILVKSLVLVGYDIHNSGLCNHFKTTGSNEQGWTTSEVESYYRVWLKNNPGVVFLENAFTKNSQRRLSDEVPFGHYGSTSLGFDVAYGIPIFQCSIPHL